LFFLNFLVLVSKFAVHELIGVVWACHYFEQDEMPWQLYTNIISTASSDKTVSLWDARSAVCVQTFYGHKASCNQACFDNKVISLQYKLPLL
jgi:WD40 repeat protein